MTTHNQDELRKQLDMPYALSESAIAHFRKNGYVKLKQVLSPEVIGFYGAEITRMVIALNTQTKPVAERNTYEKHFCRS